MPRGSLDTPFRREVVVWLTALTIASLGLGIAVFVIQPDAEVRSSGADSFSRSALGHRAFVSLLRKRGVPVLVSRHASAERAGTVSLLVLAEPQLEDLHESRAERLRVMVSSRRTTLLVLPKWRVRGPADNRGWIAGAEPLDGERASLPLRAAGVPATLSRPPGPRSCAATDAVLRRPQLLVPSGTALKPLIPCGDGVLLGELATADGGRLFVLSDPDVIANHGLAQGNTAQLALVVLERTRQAGQVVVVDETLHGFERVPSLWRDLFMFPLLPATLQATLTLAALVASGLARFGRPVPVSASATTGRALLIENTATLLCSAGHSGHSLGRYLDATAALVARSTRAPLDAASHERRWLAQLGRRRGVRPDFEVLAASVDALRVRDDAPAAEVLAAARALHRWQGEMLHGQGTRTGDPKPRPSGGPAGGGRA